MKFQIGDNVRVKRLSELSAIYGYPHQGVYGMTLVMPDGFNFISAMESYCGKIKKVRKVFNFGYYLEETNGNYIFTDAMLDRVEVEE